MRRERWVCAAAGRLRRSVSHPGCGWSEHPCSESCASPARLTCYSASLHIHAIAAEVIISGTAHIGLFSSTSLFHPRVQLGRSVLAHPSPTEGWVGERKRSRSAGARSFGGAGAECRETKAVLQQRTRTRAVMSPGKHGGSTPPPYPFQTRSREGSALVCRSSGALPLGWHMRDLPVDSIAGFVRPIRRTRGRAPKRRHTAAEPPRERRKRRERRSGNTTSL